MFKPSNEWRGKHDKEINFVSVCINIIVYQEIFNFVS